MRRLALCCLLISGPAAAGESSGFATPVKPAPAVVHGYCYADASKYTVYFSPAFSSATVGGPGGSTPPEAMGKLTATLTAWQDAFKAYLAQKYNAIGLIQCALEDTLPKAQSSRQALLDDFRNRNPGYTVKRTFVETDWAYAGSPSPPSPSAAAAPSAKPSLTVHGYCKGDQPGKTYFSKLFHSESSQPSGQSFADQARSLTEAWKQSFTAFLAQRQGFQGTAECYAREQKQQLEWLWGRQHGLALGRSVDTEWSPAS